MIQLVYKGGHMSSRFRSRFLLFVAFFALGTLPAFAQGFCKSCHDFRTDNGYNASPSLACQNINCPNTSCPKTCFSAGPAPRFSEQLHPGLITEQRAGRLYVVAVLPGSPARGAGIEIGDELLAINGIHAGNALEPSTWDLNGAKSQAQVTIMRKGREADFKIALEPVSVIVANAWRARTTETGAMILPAALSKDSSAAAPIGPFAAGFRWEEHGDHLNCTVSDVLETSAANTAGLRVGDRIVAIDGVDISRVEPGDLMKLSASNRPLTFKLRVARGASRRELEVATDGVSMLLRELAVPPPQRAGKVALAR